MGNAIKPNRFEQYPKIVLFALFIPFVFLCDFGLTSGYHLLKYGTIHKGADRRALRERSDIFHHTFKASGKHSTQKWGKISYPLYTNSLGFKDRESRTVPLESTHYRFLFIGDSFTEGIGYPYEMTFVGLFDQIMKAENVEVLNAAVASYSPAIYFKKIEYLLNTVGLQFDHVMVFVDISDIEDEKKFYRIREGRVEWIGEEEWGIKNFVYEYTGLAKNIWIVIDRLQAYGRSDPESLRSDEDEKYGTNRHRSLWTVEDEVYSEYGQEGIRRAREHMDQLYQLLQHHNVEMTIGVYPWPDQIIHHDLDSRQVKVWREWATEHAVTFLNFFPYFITPDSDPKAILSKYFIEGDVHWNEQGHKLMAQALTEQLRKRLPSLFTDTPLP